MSDNAINTSKTGQSFAHGARRRSSGTKRSDPNVTVRIARTSLSGYRTLQLDLNEDDDEPARGAESKRKKRKSRLESERSART